MSLLLGQRFTALFRLSAVVLATLSWPLPTRAEKLYSNDKFGYTVSYPDHWFPSGNTYANAFEIRNYDSQQPEAVPERNKANLTVLDIVNESSEATDKFLDGVAPPPMPARARAPSRVEKLVIDGHRAVRVQRQIPGSPLAPGTARRGPQPQEPPKLYHAVGTYIADGKHVIAIEGTAPAESDPNVVQEMLQVGESVRFANPKK